jgi:hypothetical protein
MEQVAQRSGGRVLYPTGFDDLAQLYERIARELGASYSLAYGSSRPVQDGAYRRIDVTVKTPGLRVSQSRMGYYAGAGQSSASASEAIANAIQRSPETPASTSVSETIAAAVQRSLGIEAAPAVPETTPASAETASDARPVLITPIAQALLSPPERSEWRFDWEDVSNARRYQIQVNAPDISEPILNAETRTSTYVAPRKSMISPGQNARGWTWKVRAAAADGAWGPWSDSRIFDVFVDP